MTSLALRFDVSENITVSLGKNLSAMMNTLPLTLNEQKLHADPISAMT
jgi:hypothetical protein